MRFTNGFIVLHRKLWLVPIPPSARFIFITLAAHANFEDRDVLYSGEKITLKRGQILTSQREVAELTDYSLRTVNRAFQKLFDENMIIYEKKNRSKGGTVVTLVNYSKYQDIQSKDVMDGSTGITTGITTAYNINNKGNKLTIKQEENKTIVSDSPNQPPVSHNVQKIINLFSERYEQKYNRKANTNSWEKEIEKLNRIDKLSFSDIESIVRFGINDDFWSSNLMSPVGLRKKSTSNGLMKWQNIKAAMGRPDPSKKPLSEAHIRTHGCPICKSRGYSYIGDERFKCPICPASEEYPSIARLPVLPEDFVAETLDRHGFAKVIGIQTKRSV